MHLSPRYRDLLRYLSETAGWCVRDIVAGAWSYEEQGRSTSRLASLYMQDMERAGYVKRLDDKKPIAWVRTAEGTAALNRC